LSVLNATKRVYINQLKKYGNNIRYKKTRRNLFKDNL
jgi:hypothetical protein